MTPPVCNELTNHTSLQVKHTFFFTVEELSRLLQEKMSALFSGGGGDSEDDKILEEVTLDGIVKYIETHKCKNIVTMAGAGISTCKSV